MADKEIKIKPQVDSSELDKGTQSVKTYAAQLREAKKDLIAAEQQFGVNSRQYKEAQKRTNELKEAQEDLNRASKPLAERFKELGGPLGRLGGFVDEVGDKFAVLKGGLGQLGLGFKSLGQAIFSTGIGALVVILGGLIAAVVKAAKTFEPLQRATEQIGVAMDMFFELLKPITDFILNAVVGAMEGLSKAIAYVTGNMDEFNKKVAEKAATAELEKNLKKQEQFLDANGDKYDQYTNRKMKANVDYKKKVLEIDRDETLSAKQKEELKVQYREKANREINAADKARTDEAAKADAAAAKQANDDAKRRRDEKIAAQKADLDAQIQLEVDKENTNRETLKALLDKRMNMELADTKLSEAQKELIRKQYAKRLTDALKEDKDRIDAEAQKDKDKKEADRKKELEKLAADLDARIELETQKENTSRETLKTLLDQRMAVELENTELSEAQKEVIREKYKKRLEEAITADEERERNKNRKKLEDNLKGMDDAGQIEYDKESEWLKARMTQIDDAEKQELANTTLNEDQKTKIKEYYANLRKGIIDTEIQREQIAAQAKQQIQDLSIQNLASAGQLLGQIAGQNKALQIAGLVIEKGAAIAQVVIATQRAIASFAASVSPLGPAGVPVAAAYAVKAKIGAGLSIASIIASAVKGVSDINSAESDLAKGQGAPQAPSTPQYSVKASRAVGGLITGEGSSMSDSILARVSNGEYVMNSRSTSMFFPIIDSMNEMGKQPSFAVGGLFGNKRAKLRARAAEVAKQRAEQMGQAPVKTYVTAVDMSNQQQFNRAIRSRSLL